MKKYAITFIILPTILGYAYAGDSGPRLLIIRTDLSEFTTFTKDQQCQRADQLIAEFTAKYDGKPLPKELKDGIEYHCKHLREIYLLVESLKIDPEHRKMVLGPLDTLVGIPAGDNEVVVDMPPAPAEQLPAQSSFLQQTAASVVAGLSWFFGVQSR